MSHDNLIDVLEIIVALLVAGAALVAIGYVIRGFRESDAKESKEPKELTKTERGLMELLFKENDGIEESDLESENPEQAIAKLLLHYPSNVVSCPQGVVTYIIPNRSGIAHIGAHFGKEKIEERIKGLLEGNADISEDELRAALKSYMVVVLTYRRSGRVKSGKLTI